MDSIILQNLTKHERVTISIRDFANENCRCSQCAIQLTKIANMVIYYIYGYIEKTNTSNVLKISASINFPNGYTPNDTYANNLFGSYFNLIAECAIAPNGLFINNGTDGVKPQDFFQVTGIYHVN